MNARAFPHAGLAAALVAVLTSVAACSLVRPPPFIATAAAIPLLDTHWRLVQLGARVIDNPSGAQDVHIVLSAASGAVTGHAGCNRIFGRYALENDLLKLDALGGTKMFCESRMELEQSFTNALMSVLRWRITGRTLELLDERGQPVATFEAAPATG